MKFPAGTTQVRYAAPSREYMLKLARLGSRVCHRPGPSRSIIMAAICDWLQVALTENDVLRSEVARLKKRLAAADGWNDEPTRKSDAESYPVLVARTTRTDLHRITEPDRGR